MIFFIYFLPQGDTLENVAQELNCITETGHYIFQYGEAVDGEIQRFLEYDVRASPDSLQGQGGGQKTVHRVKNNEEIRNFLTKLGFLNRDEDRDFLHLSQVRISPHRALTHVYT